MKSRLFLFFILFGLQPILRPMDLEQPVEAQEKSEDSDELPESFKKYDDWFLEKDHSFTLQSLKDALKVFVLGFGTSNIVMNVMYNLFGTSEWRNRQVMPDLGILTPITPIMVGIVVPVVEELEYRAFIDNSIDVIISIYLPFSSGKRDVRRGYMATVLSSLIFAYGHEQENCRFGPIFIHSLIGGIFYSRAMRRYNLSVPILAHMINNIGALALAHFQSRNL